MPVYLRTLIFTVLVPGTFAGLVPWMVASASPGTLPFDEPLALGAWRHLGWPVLLLGVAGYLSCAFHFTFEGGGTPFPLDAPKRFVAVGLYRFVRNPMYTSVGTTILGQGLLYGRASVWGYLAILWLVFHLMTVLYEEPHLRKTFGEEYTGYCARVPRWTPRFTPAR